MRFAYADPPYIGQAKRHYGSPEVDHCSLVSHLVGQYPDGWALSLSSPTLREILAMCPETVRVAAWVKPFCAFKRGVRPAYAWEPVVFCGGRNPCNGHKANVPEKNGKQMTPKDFYSASITLKKGLVGAKPLGFCHWILDLLNFQFGDAMDDLFPGTGIMAEAVRERNDFLQRRKDASGEPSKPNRPKPEGSEEPSGVGRSASLTRSSESRAIRQP